MDEPSDDLKKSPKQKKKPLVPNIEADKSGLENDKAGDSEIIDAPRS